MNFECTIYLCGPAKVDSSRNTPSSMCNEDREGRNSSLQWEKAAIYLELISIFQAD